MRNYFNAKVACHDNPNDVIEIIVKVGDVDTSDDMFVDEYVAHQKDLERIKNEGHPEFRLLEYWKNPAPKVDNLNEPILEPARTMIEKDFEDWMTGSEDNKSNNDNLDELSL